MLGQWAGKAFQAPDTWTTPPLMTSPATCALYIGRALPLSAFHQRMLSRGGARGRRRRTRKPLQTLMRDRRSDMSADHSAVGGYSGMPDSDISTNFWLSGSASAARSSACRQPGSVTRAARRVLHSLRGRGRPASVVHAFNVET